MRSGPPTSTILRAGRTSLWACVLLCSLSKAWAGSCATQGTLLESRYATGLAALKAGDIAESYLQLHAAYQGCPENPGIRNDYILAAVASGRASEALAIAARLDERSLPVYVLESLGLAARDDRRPDLAIHYYDIILATQDDIGARVGRALALIDQGNGNQARGELRALESAYPGRIDVLEALSLADESVGDNIGALATAQALLEIDPHHGGALRLRYRALLRSGAAHRAMELTSPQLLSQEDRSRALRDQLAFEFRWARDDPGDARTRAQRMDQAIARIRVAVADQSTDRGVRAGLRGDLVADLVERGRSRDAVNEYERLIADRVAVESYVTAAAVTAYEALNKPQHAAALFEALPANASVPYEAQASYVYALLDSGRYQAATKQADTLLSKEPAYQYANFPELRIENPYYARALVLAALVRTYTDRLAAAQKRIEAIVDLAPASREARLALAETQSQRGWPRAAADDLRLLQQEDPGPTDLLPQLFSDQLRMANWLAAQDSLTRMQAALPADDPGPTRADRDWDLHQMPEVGVDGHLGRSYGGPAGVVDSEIGEYVYSSPIDWNYRVYAHLDQTEGEPPQGVAFRHAVGAGLEYHSSDWLATGELLEIDHSGPYPQASVEATPSDYWKIGGSYAARTLDIPIAAVVVGVHADRLALSTGYRASESRDFGTQVIREQFSDGNLRVEWAGYWRERWITGPIYKLDSRLDLDTSRNTLGDTNYFNPQRDFSVAVTFQNQWLQFRHGNTSISHEIDVGLGNYTQQRYGTGAVQLLQYLLVYQATDRLTLKAGGGTTIRPFDGQREHLDALVFNVDGRF
jgi:biofilm PGA synthesis protein PgaA